MNINKWEIYCNTEQTNVYKYLDYNEPKPTECSNNNTHSINEFKTKIIETIYDNYTKSLTKWNVYCDTERNYVTGYYNGSSYPEYCFNNKDHIVSKKPILLKTIINNTQISNIKEETITDNPTGGRFRCEGFEISIPTNSMKKKIFSWPYPISALILRFISEETNRGDYVNCYVYPTIYLNKSSSNINQNISIIPVNSTTPFSLNTTIIISDSYNTENLGKITSINTENSTITTEFETQNSYNKNAYISYLNPVGIITESLTSGQYEITCSYSVIQNVKKGYILTIENSINSESLGEIFEINENTYKIIIQRSPTNNYSIGSKIYAKLQIIKNYKLTSPTEHIIGSGKIGASYIPKLNIISIEYSNNSMLNSKTFNWYSEILY